MSIHAIKQAFQSPSQAEPIRCIAARMRYTEDRKGQILEFDIVHGGVQKTIISDPIPHGQSLIAAAAKIAADVVAGVK